MEPDLSVCALERDGMLVFRNLPERQPLQQDGFGLAQNVADRCCGKSFVRSHCQSLNQSLKCSADMYPKRMSRPTTKAGVPSISSCCATASSARTSSVCTSTSSATFMAV